MKKVLLIGIISILSGSVLGQDTVLKVQSDQVFKVEGSAITNSLTDKHINIPGTKLSLIPPVGFVKAPNFSGFQQQESGSSILITDIPGSFETISKGITRESLLSKGMEVEKMENFTLNDLPAILVSSTQQSNGVLFSKYSVFCGTNEQVWIINGAFPKELKEIGKEILQSILTFYYETNKDFNQMEGVGFEVDSSNTLLKFAKIISNSLILTNDGNFPPGTPEKSYMIVSQSFSTNTIEDRKLFCLNRIRTVPFEITSVDSISEVSIDGISGYEIIASGQNVKKKESIQVYQIILFSDDLYYIIIAYTNQNFEKNINEFKKVGRTFKRK